MEYRIETAASRERIYSMREPGGEWVVIDENRAKILGIWKDPRGGQYSYKDELASPDEITATTRGMYDPRPASGEHIADILLVRCVLCGARISEILQYEKRDLVHHVQSGRYYWSGFERWSLYRCTDCTEGALVEPDVAKIWARAEEGRRTGRKLTIKI